MTARWKTSRRNNRPAAQPRTLLRAMPLEDRVTPAAMYPDFQVLQSYLSGWTVNNLGGSNREIRFSTGLANAGQGAFELRGVASYITDPDGTQRQVVNQRVYQSEGGFQDRFAGYFVYHPGHGHVHYDNMAIARVRMRLPGDVVGDVVATGSKTSFCLIDINRFNGSLPGSPTSGVYGSCGTAVQGISVGWNDVYSSGLAGQSVNITGLVDGNYFLEVEADPANTVLETNEGNNLTRIPITLNGLPPSGFRIQSSSPANAVNDPVSYVDVSFNQAVNAATFTPADVVFNGPGGAIAVTSVTAQSSTTFRINFAQQSAVGIYTMTVGPNIANSSGGLMDQNNNGVAGEAADALTNIFSITAPRVNSASPTGAVQAPVNTIRITYNKPMQSSSFTTADIASFTGPGGVNLASMIASINPVTAGGTSLSFDIALNDNITAIGPYSLILEPSVTDAYGNFVDQNGDGASNASDRFTVNFSVVTDGASGPDAFGYDALATPTQNFELVGQSNVTSISFSNTDDGATAINIGTDTFNFYGTTYTGSQLFVSTNGLVTFGSGSTAYDNGDLTGLTVPAIAALWDDWNVGTGTPMAMYKRFDLNGDGINDRLVIEWNQIDHYQTSPSSVTFQAVLDLNTGATPGSVLLNYQDLSTGDATANGVSASVGLRGPGTTPTIFLVSNNGTSPMVGDNKAIKIGVPRVQSITRLNPNPAVSGDLMYEVRFDHAVVGVDLADFTLTTTGSVTGATVQHLLNSTDPAVYQIRVNSGVGAGTVRLNLTDNGTIFGTIGGQLGGTGNTNGSFNGEVYTVTQAAPRALGVNIQDGSLQRSMIELMQIPFDRAVNFAGAPANSFIVTGPNGPVAVNVDLSLSSPDSTIARLTFSGAGTENGSLADGRYTLRLVAANISIGGQQLDGNGDGVGGDDMVLNFHRLFGDINGDARIDIADFGSFSTSYNKTTGQAGFDANFDFNNDGRIDIADFGQFSIRYFTNLP